MKKFMPKISNQTLKTLLLLTVLATLSACARGGNSGSTDQSSRLTDPTTTSKEIAYCSEGKGADISSKLKVYKDITNTIRMEYVYARLTALPEKFKTDGSYISMWKWMAVSGGTTNLDNNALKFMIVNPNTGLALTAWKTTLRWGEVKTAASAMGITDPQAFFNTVTILVDLKDVDGEYDVLKITQYDLTSNKAISQMDALLPLFYANPADYALEANGLTRATILQNLHPFKSNADQGLTSTQFAAMAKTLCF